MLPRLEKKMDPSSEPTKLEGAGQAYEYAAAGKLKGCKALITGGEYASRPHLRAHVFLGNPGP